MSIFYIITVIVLVTPETFAGVSNPSEVEGSPAVSETSGSSWFTLQHFQSLVETVSPLLEITAAAYTEPRSTQWPFQKVTSAFRKSLSDLRKTLSKSAKMGEGWPSFAKRVAAYFLLGLDQASKPEEKLNVRIAKKLFQESPQFLKDTLRSFVYGGVSPILEERIEDTIQTILEKRTQVEVDPEGKQGAPFDPVVFGVNSLINMFWFTAFNAFMLPNMGLENLFSPDYDFDYEALEKDEDEEEVAEEEETEEEQTVEEEGREEAGAGEVSLVRLPLRTGGGHYDYPENNSIDGPVPSTHSTYSHYPGQRLKLMEHQQATPTRHFYMFKMYTPKKHH